jgi:hypothetical protein
LRADDDEEERRRVLLGEEPGGSRSQGRKNEGGGTRCWEEQISGGKRSGLQWGCRRGCGATDGRHGRMTHQRFVLLPFFLGVEILITFSFERLYFDRYSSSRQASA